MDAITQAFAYLYEISKLEHYPFRILKRCDSVDESIVDALVLPKEAVEKPFCLVRITLPIKPIDHPTLLEKTAEQTRSAKVDYFIVWNLRDTILWQTPPKGTPVSREHRLKTYFTIHEVTTDQNAPIDALAQTFIKSRAKELLDDLTNLYRDGHLHLVDVDATFFVHRLTQAVLTMWPSIKNSLMLAVDRDAAFKNGLFDWAVKQGIANYGDEAFYETVARQVVYRLLGKVIFYQTLRRHAKQLPEIDFSDVELPQVMPTLQEYFAQAQAINYQAIFEIDLSDEIRFPGPAVKELVQLVNDLNRFNFSNMPQDVIGEVFERLIPTEERHALGQYFTREDLVDFINAFCIRNKDDKILDPTCGTGTFLIRAYNRLQLLGQREHPKLLSQLWGVDIAPFPTELATINLYRQKVADYDNFPRILCENFFQVKPEQTFKFPPPKAEDANDNFIDEPLPLFDAAVGNFPFIRQELIEKRLPGFKAQMQCIIAEDWLLAYPQGFKMKKKTLQEFERVKEQGMPLDFYFEKAELKLSGQADIYAYLFFHTARFVSEDGGRLGFITSNAWLDVGYGYELQRFFLNNFKIIAIIESRCEPWFEQAAVNTIVTILERCSNPYERDNHLAKFVKVNKPLKELIPQDMKTNAANRWSGLAKLVGQIESVGKEYFNIVDGKWVNTLTGHRTYEDANFRIRVARQSELLKEVEQSGKTAKWGVYLRAPEVYFEILERCKDKLAPLKQVAEIRRGYTTGINKFFYLTAEEAKEWEIEEEFLKPVLKSPQEFPSILVDARKLATLAFMCNKTQEELIAEGKSGALKYIQTWDNPSTCPGRHWRDVPTVKNRKPGWWALPDSEPAQIFWSKAYDTKLLQRYCPLPIIADCRVYFLAPQQNIDAKLLAAVLNSTFSLLFLELTGRVILGEGVLDVMVEDAREYMLIPDPGLFADDLKTKILNTFDILLAREIKPIFEEVKMKDRQGFDRLILEALGLEAKTYLPRIYEGLTGLVRERIELGKMRGKVKKAKTPRDSDSVRDQVLQEILPNGPKVFPDDFLEPAVKSGDFVEISIPGEPLRLNTDMLFKPEIYSESGFRYEAKNPTEAKYILYAQRPGITSVRIPAQPIAMFKTVVNYEKYLRELRKQLLEAYFNRTLEHKIANRLTQSAFQELGLPEVAES